MFHMPARRARSCAAWLIILPFAWPECQPGWRASTARESLTDWEHCRLQRACAPTQHLDRLWYVANAGHFVPSCSIFLSRPGEVNASCPLANASSHYLRWERCDARGASATARDLVALAARAGFESIVFLGDSTMKHDYEAVRCGVVRDVLLQRKDASLAGAPPVGHRDVCSRTPRDRALCAAPSSTAARPEGAELAVGNATVTALYFKIDLLDQARNLSALLDGVASRSGRAIFVLNEGLHLHAPAPARLETLRALLVGQIAPWFARNVAHLALWRETYPQHFRGSSGGGSGRFDDKGWDYKDSVEAARWSGCLSQSSGAQEPPGFADILDELGIPAVATRDIFGGRGEMHRSGGDCTHYCYTPRLFEPLVDRVYQAVMGRVRRIGGVVAP